MNGSLSPDFWQKEHEWLVRIIQPRLQALTSAGVSEGEKRLNGLGIYFDNAKPHQEAAAWARKHTDEILQQFNTRTQGLVGEKLAGWIETPGQTMGDLVELLKPVLDGNPARAWAMAVTETTRAYSAGNNLAYQAAGVPPMAYMPPGHVHCRCDTAVRRVRSSNQWVVVWLTERDGLVCSRPLQTPWGIVEGCKDLHGIVISQGDFLGKKFSEL